MKRIPGRNQQRPKAPVYPFASIVGQDEMKLALLLNVIDPLIGGVLIMGHRGTGKSTAVRALADLLPQIWKVSNCQFGCDPADEENLCDECYETLEKDGKLARRRSNVPVINLPLGATEDRVCGTIDIERALKSGVKAFEPGLLASANRGFLYVDEVNLLEDHLVDLLLDVAVTGRNTVEREGISLDHPSRFVLVGSGNPEEGELRPQLVDRFGLCAEVKTIENLSERVKIVELREAFDRSPAKFRAAVESDQEQLRRKLTRARKLKDNVVISKVLLRAITSLCLELGIDGHRGELTISRAARALASFEGRHKASEEDIRRVAAMSLRHRLRRNPLDPSGGDDTRIEQALENNVKNAIENKALNQRANSQQPKASTSEKPRVEAEANLMDRQTPASLPASLPLESLGRRKEQRPFKNSTLRTRSKLTNRITATRGRYSGSVTKKPRDSNIALDATLRATVLAKSRNPLSNSELRFKKFNRKQGTLFILAIDTSGSMALNRIERAKGALVSIFSESYIQRDRVALVSFRGRDAERVLPPSQSMSRARRVLDELPMGGATPLSSALVCALETARRAAREGTERIVLLIFTDGRANVPHSTRNEKGMILDVELDKLGIALQASGISTTIVDTETKFTSGGKARAIAERLGARYVYLASPQLPVPQMSVHL